MIDDDGVPLLVELGDVTSLTFGSGRCPEDQNV